MPGFTLPDFALSPTDLQHASLAFAVVFLAIAFGLGRRMIRDLFAHVMSSRGRKGKFRCGLPIRAGDAAVGRDGDVPVLVQRLIQNNRWDEMAELMRQAAADTALYGNGVRLSHVVLDAALAPIRSAIKAPYGRRGDARTLNRLLTPFREAAKDARGSSEICALTALALIEAGWAAHGALDGRAPTDAGTETFHELLREADGWLKQADPDAAITVYMAKAIYMTGFVQPNPVAALSDRFSRWVMVDPTDCYPYEQRALHIMPGWYGTFEDVEALCDRAIRATGKLIGDGAYARIMARLSAYVDLRQIPGYSHQKISVALGDLIERTGTQAAANHWAAWALAQGLDETPRTLVSRFLREVHLDEWSPEGGYAEFYGLYARSRSVKRQPVAKAKRGSGALPA